jgi:hypothetical protein
MALSVPFCVLLSVMACASSDSRGDGDSARDSVPKAVGVPIDSGAPRLEPRDEANASFKEFRERTLAALARRDTAYLHSIVAAEIRTSFGDGGGLGDFKQMWKTSEASSPVWETLRRVLEMGGKQTSDSMFTAPYVYAFWPDSIDAFSHIAVTTPDAAVHALPNAGAPTLGSARHSILRAVEWTNVPGDAVPSDTSWVKVEWRDRSGWLRVADAWSPVSWRAMFARRGERWLMVLFVAGD